MEVQAILKNVRMSAQKVREVTRQVQGMSAQQALATLSVVPRKSARLVAKALRSAIANAQHLRDEWQANKIQQSLANLQTQVANTRNHKRRNSLRRRLECYQSFLDSQNRLAPGKLWVKEAVAQTALTLKRFTPKARGSAGPILKRHCHIKIVLSDE